MVHGVKGVHEVHGVNWVLGVESKTMNYEQRPKTNDQELMTEVQRLKPRVQARDVAFLMHEQHIHH